MTRFAGGPASFLTKEIVKATSDAVAGTCGVHRGPGSDELPSDAGMCLMEIRDRTRLVRWRTGAPIELRLVRRLCEPSMTCPSTGCIPSRSTEPAVGPSEEK